MFKLITILLCYSITAVAQIQLELPEIDGNVKHHKPPKDWEINTGSPDVVNGQGDYFGEGFTLENIEGETNGKTMVWLMCTRPNSPEGMKTEINGLKIGEEYAVSVMWQQCSMMAGDVRKYWGGDLQMSVQGEIKIFKSSGLDDGWQEATIVFIASSRSVIVTLAMHNPDYDPNSTWGGSIVVDNYCESCIKKEISAEELEAGKSIE